MFGELGMKQVLIIPDIHNLQESFELTQRYSLGFEYNDFFDPNILDDTEKISGLLKEYGKHNLPTYCTMHGAFYDVIPFSKDNRIREVSLERIEQSIEIARNIGARAVVFHTNYNPFLNSDFYLKEWIARNVDLWSMFLEKNTDVSIYLENMFETTPDIMEHLSEKLCKYKNYGVCLDYAHAAISKTSPSEWAKRLGRFVRHVHINDNDLISDLHLAWGSGKIDREKFYLDYENYMKDASVLVETSSIENQRASLKMLIAEGFI